MGCSCSNEPIKTMEPMEPIKMGKVESVKIKLEEESDSNVKERKKIRDISDDIGIVESVNNKLNEESWPILDEPKGIVKSVNNKLNEESEIKGVIKGDNKNSEEEVNCFC